MKNEQEASEWVAQYHRTSGKTGTVVPHPTRKGFFIVTLDDTSSSTWSGKQLREAGEALSLRPDFKTKEIIKTEIVDVHIIMNGQRGGFDMTIVHSPQNGAHNPIVTEEHATSIRDASAILDRFIEKHT